MEDTGRQRKNSVGYEYKEIIAERSRISFLLDGYECFGWEVDEKRTEHRESKEPSYPKKEVLLEKSKTSAATIYALVTGVIGTAFMAGSVFAVTAQQPHVILSIILAVPAFVGWIIP